MAAALVLPLSIAASNVALFALTLALIAARFARPRARPPSRLDEPALAALLVYIAAGALAGFMGDGVAKSLHDSAKDAHRLWALVLFLSALPLTKEDGVWNALDAGLILAAVVGLSQSLLSPRIGGAPARAHAFVHPVTFGEQMAFGALGAVSRLSRPKTSARGISWAALAACSAALVFSQTRAALAAFALGALVIAWIEPRARRLAAGAVGLSAISLTIAQWLRYDSGAARQRIASMGARVQSVSGDSTRKVLWRTAWKMFIDHPWTGVGPGHYLTEFSKYHSVVLEGQTTWASAHDLYLQQLAERGLIGEAALLALLGTLLVRAGRAQRARRDAAALWAAAAVPAFLVMNLTETAWQTEQLATLFLLIWALGCSPRAIAGSVLRDRSDRP